MRDSVVDTQSLLHISFVGARNDRNEKGGAEWGRDER